MKLEINMTFDSIAEIANIGEALDEGMKSLVARQAQSSEEAPAEPVKKKAGRKAKKKAAATAPEPDPVEPDPEPDPEPPAEDGDDSQGDVPEVDEDALIAAAESYLNANGLEATKALFEKHGGASLKRVPHENRPALLEEMTA